MRELGGTAVYDENYSLYAVALMHLGRGVATAIQWIVPLVAAAAVVFTRGRGEIPALRTFIVVGLGCSISLVSSPICWMHYHVLGTVLLLICLRPRNAGEPLGWCIIRNLVAVIALLMLCTSFLVTEWLWLGDYQSRAARLAGAATALFILGLCELQQQRRRSIGNENPAGISSAVLGEPAHASSNIR
jgi:hypothetical protein